MTPQNSISIYYVVHYNSPPLVFDIEGLWKLLLNLLSFINLLLCTEYLNEIEF